MPKVQAGSITMNYEQQGSGEPLILIPYLGADNACYAFQVPDYSKYFTCISVDLRGTGESDKPGGTYSSEMFADDVAALMQALFPWCFTPELYVQKPDYIKALCEFTRNRPKQPVDAFMQQSDAVINHDAEAQLGKIRAPTQITFGRHDMVCSPRFADPLRNGIRDSELHIFEDCSHAGLYENVPAFNEKSLEFLRKHAG